VTDREPVDLAASVARRLKNQAQHKGQEIARAFERFALERFLYRLSVSDHRDQFVLKGALLFALWEDEPHRPTRDIDLLGFGEDSAERLAHVFADVCSVSVEPDGVIFDPASVRVSDIRVGQTYQGKHITIDGRMGKTRLPVRIDIGFGDALATPGPMADYPTLLDFPAPRLLVYPAAAVIAEKVHAMAEHGMLNSRMKDLYDVDALAIRLSFSGDELVTALRATFGRRGTALTERFPAALTPEFAADATKLAQWQGFLKRTRLADAKLSEVVAALRRFLAEPYLAAARGAAFTQHWPAGGPWVSAPSAGGGTDLS